MTSLKESDNKWLDEQHNEKINFNPKNNMSVAVKKTSLARMMGIMQGKYQLIYNTMNTVVVVMKLHDYKTNKQTNYGTVFCELLSDMTPYRRKTLDKSVIHGKVAFSFYSHMPSYTSCDGEYRSGFSSYQSLVEARNKFPMIWYDLDEKIAHIKTRRQWSLYANYFYPKLEQEKRSSDVEFAVKNEMLSTIILIASWFHAIWGLYNKTMESHVNDDYVELFSVNKKEDIEWIKSLINKFGEDRLEQFDSQMMSTKDEHASMSCGYKMVPLNMIEAQRPLDIRYSPWREWYICRSLGDLVINQISPGFPVLFDWFYIKNSRKGLYDNKSQYDRMKHSEMAKDILHVLYEAQRGTYFVSEAVEGIEKSQDSIKKWISKKFKKLNDEIGKSIDYGIGEIIMSEVTLAFVTEHVGSTFAESLMMSKNKKLHSRMNMCFSSSGKGHFAKYVFDVCYSLYCANSRMGVIHGDLHLNNATIARSNVKKEKQKKKNKSEEKNNERQSGHVLYVLDMDQYAFENTGHFGCLIDFSRGIINPMFLNKLHDESIPQSYQNIKDERKFREKEIKKLLNMYIRMFPNKEKIREELVVLLKKNFEAAFKLLTCMDIYMFVVRLERSSKRMNIDLGKESFILLRKISSMSEKFLNTDMSLLWEDKTYADKILNDEWPLRQIIKSAFAHYSSEYQHKSVDKITDVYIYDNPIKSSTSTWNKFPEYFKTFKKGNKYDTELQKKRKKIRMEWESQKKDNFQMVNYIAMRHGQKLM